MSDELREAQRALEAACADRDALRVTRDALTRERNELSSRLSTLELRERNGMAQVAELEQELADAQEQAKYNGDAARSCAERLHAMTMRAEAAEADWQAALLRLGRCLKVMRAVRGDLLDRASLDDGVHVVNLSNTPWRWLCNEIASLSSGTAPDPDVDGSAKAAPSQWWCPTHGGLIDKGQPCLDGCVESDFAVERQSP
jgi:hypothetical protein